MNDFRFPRQYRIRKREEFTRVYERNVYAADDVLVMLACENDLPWPRLGLAVSRKVGNAVVRNQWKRRIREAFRHCRAELPPGIDMVIRPRRGGVCDFHAIQASLPGLARRVMKRLK